MSDTSHFFFSRPNWAEINLDALRHNARALSAHAAPASVLAVIKAGAYGHGAFRVANALQREDSVTHLGVASVDEGLQLRSLGIRMPILLLSALLPEEIGEVVRAELTPTVFTLPMAQAVQNEAQRQNRRVEVHFKVDTGMGRLGANWDEAVSLWRQLQTFEHLNLAGIYTHLACADEDPDELSATQIARFERVLSEISAPQNVLRHATNSAGTIRYPQAHYDLVRPGLALYGAHPCPGVGPAIELQPVMSWKARITSVKTIAAGQSVSYGAQWVAAHKSQIAIVPCGYADGYFRSLSNRGEVLINGLKYPVVGRVTMDQIMVDVTEQPVTIGDEVVLFGEGLPVEEVAGRAGTIAYELLCSVSVRVPRVDVARRP